MHNATEKQALDLFFAISTEKRRRDIATAPNDFRSVGERIKSFLAIPRALRSAASIAAFYHDQLLQSIGLASHSHKDDDITFFFVVSAAESVAEAACMYSAGDNGRLKELHAQMAQIEKAHGREFFFRNEGPEEFQALSEASEELYERIHDTIVGHILDNYGFPEFARLMSDDPMMYDIRREVGRRAVHGTPEGMGDIHSRLNEVYREKYGDKALIELRKRLAALGLE
jgi:hypothetical protein